MNDVETLQRLKKALLISYDLLAKYHFKNKGTTLCSNAELKVLSDITISVDTELGFQKRIQDGFYDGWSKWGKKKTMSRRIRAKRSKEQDNILLEYEVTNFLIWLRSECLRSDLRIDFNNVTDETLNAIVKQWLAYREEK